MSQYDRERNLAYIVRNYGQFSNPIFVYPKYHFHQNSKPSTTVVARLGGRIAVRHGVVVRWRALTPLRVLKRSVVLRLLLLLLCIDAILLRMVVVAGRASGFTDLSVWRG